MLSDLQASTFKFSYIPMLSMAVVRTSQNALAWLPLFQIEGTTDYVVYLRGRWQSIEGLAGLERFEEVKPLKTIKLYDTATNEVIDTGVLAGSPV